MPQNRSSHSIQTALDFFFFPFIIVIIVAAAAADLLSHCLLLLLELVLLLVMVILNTNARNIDDGAMYGHTLSCCFCCC